MTRLLADAGTVIGGGDGLNIWIPVADESAALLTLAAHGIGASGGEPFHVNGDRAPHLRVTVGLVRDTQSSYVAGALTDAAHARPRGTLR